MFEIIGKDILPLPATLAIAEFKELWDRDKSEDKSVAIKELSYIYHLCDLKSPYRQFADDEREEYIRKDIFDDKWKPDTDVLAAKEKYLLLNRTKASLLLEDAYNAMDKIRDYFKSIDLTKKDKYGKLMYSSKDFIGNLKSMADVFKSIKSLEKEVDKEHIEHGRIRGGSDKGIFEDPENV